MDACFRFAYITAYHIARIWWILRRPSITGSNAAIWQGSKILLLKSSYRAGWQFPGGFMRKSEDPLLAAIRETREEIGVVLAPAELSGPIIVKCSHEFRKELNYIFEVRRDHAFDLFLDNREIVDAAYFTVKDVARLITTPTVRAYLENRSQQFGLIERQHDADVL